MPKPRLDDLLIDRKEFQSLHDAQSACLAGAIKVNGITVTKPGTRVNQDAQLQVKPPKRFVSRGGEKLAGALLDFQYNPQDLNCIDVGASSGGFTDCLLKHGAAQITAVDVGYGQFDYQLRQNLQVRLFERTSITKAEPAKLGAPFDLLVADLSFTGLARLAPQLARLLGNLNDGLVLVKPQFELPKDLVKNGVVLDAKNHQKAIEIAIEGLKKSNLQPQALTTSKLPGPKGNIEFFLWVKKAGIPANINIEKLVSRGINEHSFYRQPK